MKFLLVVLVIGTLGLVIKSRHKPAHNSSAAAPPVAAEAVYESSDGWTKVPSPAGTDPKRVVIVAAPNCSSAESQQAVELARQLETQKIPCTSTGSIGFAFENEADAARVARLMNGSPPIVFVNGQAKSNPTFNEVVMHYWAMPH